ncbi:hypothetical protein BMETH_1304_0 [methanotrophic bacterial endosymbiont of Bathymodiolus sp.]|nr:hypothetical protein BMETH_1304_0 [methanotrophic bacterial endosymbiont of Bathymodiolus sp.]
MWLFLYIVQYIADPAGVFLIQSYRLLLSHIGDEIVRVVECLFLCWINLQLTCSKH